MAPDLNGDGNRPRLLLVDDELLNLQILYQIFRDDHEVFVARDGGEALAICKAQTPDLVLLDVVMPGMDGYQVCSQLKADVDTRDIPVIFVTGHNSADEESRGFAVGAVDFVSKPVNPLIVRARVKTHLALKAQADALRELALVDSLTGIANRHRFEERFRQEWNACKRDSLALSVCLIDVDHFKAFNDRYGHAQGDNCLRAVAGLLKQSIRRPRDLVARYDGEAFACVLANTDAAGAGAIAESLRDALHDASIPHAVSPTARVVTVSIGIATTIPCTSDLPETLLRSADAALCRAKAKGRNRIEIATTES